jgi:hypothetical protein
LGEVIGPACRRRRRRLGQAGRALDEPDLLALGQLVDAGNDDPLAGLRAALEDRRVFAVAGENHRAQADGLVGGDHPQRRLAVALEDGR